MRISKEQTQLILKSGNSKLIEKVLAADSVGDLQNILSRDETALLQRTKTDNKVNGLVRVKTFEERVQERDSRQEELINDKSPDVRELRYHLYNMCYDKPLEELMDDLSKYADSKGISAKALRYVVENLDKNYTVKYEAQYNAESRELLAEDDLASVLTDPEAAIEFQEREREREEKEEEEEAREEDFFGGFFSLEQ